MTNKEAQAIKDILERRTKELIAQGPEACRAYIRNLYDECGFIYDPETLELDYEAMENR